MLQDLPVSLCVYITWNTMRETKVQTKIYSSLSLYFSIFENFIAIYIFDKYTFFGIYTT